MQGFPSTFWGKLKTDSAGTPLAWHPLEAHSADVAACLEALLNVSLIRERLAKLANLSEFTPAHVARLSALTALHDVGKFNHGFQAKANRQAPRKAGHVKEVLAMLGDGSPESDSLLRAIGWESMENWASLPGGTQPLLLAAIAHHGRPVGFENCGRAQPALWKPEAGRDPIEGARRLFQRIQQWFPEAFQTQVPPFPDSAPFQHAFSGLVTLADWLGSDSNFFPFSEPTETDRMPFARAQAARAVASLGLTPHAYRAVLGSSPITFSRVSPYPARPSQEAMLQLPIPSGGSVEVLEAETGAGKTEAALARFLKLFQAGKVDGLYFALPTRTAATQIHERIAESVKLAFPDPERRPAVVLAVPGYLVVDDRQGIRLPGFEVLWNDDDHERWRHRGWAAEHPKRYLAGTIVIGTIDQALLSALAVNHSHMRATALLRHLLVVDEVHASDAYMNRLLEIVLSRHVGAGGHALLMSATLGANARERFLQAASGTPHPTPSYQEALKRPYPAISHWQEGKACTLQAIATRIPSKSIAVSLRPWADDPEAIVREALEAASNGARVLVLRNTVRDCLDTQVTLETLARQLHCENLLFRLGDRPVPHHSRYAAEDRKKLDRAIEAYFGKAAPNGIGLVAVATQTVQQSLDIDADYLLSDLCPMDVLLQRLGRLHRHGDRPRPHGFDSPAKAVVLVPSERDLSGLILAHGGNKGEARGAHGYGTVYEDLRVLEATWLQLEKRQLLTVPEDNRDLVEATTHPDALKQIADQKGDLWQHHGTKIEGIRVATRGIAKLNASNWHEEFGTKDSLFPTGALESRISTRLGEGDRVVEFDPPVRGPFGLPLKRLNLPAQFARTAASDASAAHLVLLPDGGIAFTYGSRRFLYDRLGLRPESAAPPSSEDDYADA